jgi:hypothetical protein
MQNRINRTFYSLYDFDRIEKIDAHVHINSMNPAFIQQSSVSNIQPIDFYDKCYEYYALNKDPFVPVTQSQEIMNIIETCGKNEENNE